MTTPSEAVAKFAAIATSIATSAVNSQLGKTLVVTHEPMDTTALEAQDDADPVHITGHFSVQMNETPGTMTVTLSPTDDEDALDFQLAIALDGAEEEIVFHATVEDTIGLADTYQAILEAKIDEQNDLA
jgi:hypothetical protein